jgi:ketosteroid isomerase-like protein
MSTHTPHATEQAFFRALIESDYETLQRVLADDFVLIDVMSGSEVTKAALIEAICGGQLKFESIERVEYRERVYERTVVVTGQTEMAGHYGGQAFRTSSRYTHVFVDDGETWRMVSAQGTQIAAPQSAA